MRDLQGKFRVVLHSDRGFHCFPIGTEVTLVMDDGSSSPVFTDGYMNQYVPLEDVRKIGRNGILIL